MSHFNEVASEWDSAEKIEKMRVLAKNAREYLGDLSHRSILDFGCGTGLFGLELMDQDSTLIGVDTSRGMLDVFDKKVAGHSEVKSIFIDLESSTLEEKFDIIITSMAFHHLNHPEKMLEKFKKMLNPGGKVGIVDLDAEDGTFHPDNHKMGVKHHGFSKGLLHSWAEQCGFDFEHHIINQIEKNNRVYGQFLAIYSL